MLWGAFVIRNPVEAERNVAKGNDQPQQPSRYRLMEMIEEGVAGKLYRARDTRENATVLLKLVPLALSRDPQFRRYFYDRWTEREATVQHPNVARIVEVGLIGEQYFAVVEDLPGERLSDRLKSAPLDPDETLDIMRQVAEALRVAHRENIVAGHLKPTDIFLTKDNKDRLLAKVLFLDMGTGSSDGVLSLFGDLSGPPKYMAPEVIRGGIPDTRSDLFALGVIAYQMLTGQEPFPSEHPIGYLFANCNATLVPPAKVSAAVPGELSAVVCRCLANGPEQRYGSAQKIIDDLDRCVLSLKTGSATVVPRGTDSAFARHYEIPAAAMRSGERRHAPSTIAVAGLAVTTLVLLFIVAGSLAGIDILGMRRREAGGPSENGTARRPGAGDADEPGAGVDDPAALLPAETAGARQHNARPVMQAAMSAWRERYSVSGAYDMALAAFLNVAKRYHDQPEARQANDMAAEVCCAWAKAEQAAQKFGEAEAHYRQAIECAPPESAYADLARRELPKLIAAWAQDIFERGNYGEALAKYEQVQREFPSSLEASLLATYRPRIQFRIGYDLWQQEGKLQDALARFQEVLDNYGASDAAEDCRRHIPDLYLAIAKAEIGRGSLSEAQSQLSMLKQKYGGTRAGKQATEMEAEILFKLFVAAHDTGRAKEADGYFKALMADYGSSAWAVRAAGRRLGLAPGEGEKLLDLHVARTEHGEAGALMARMEYHAARSKLERLVRLTPAQSEVRGLALAALPQCMYYGALYDQGSGRREEAQEALKKVAAGFGYTSWAGKARKVREDAGRAPEDMVYVPSGPFRMGASRSELIGFLKPRLPKELFEDAMGLDGFLALWGYAAEMPGQVVETGAFYIDRTEVTNEAYKKFVGATGHAPPSDWTAASYPAGLGQRPVRSVAYSDAAAFAKWAGKRLPTEAEWEKAARGTDGRLYPWGNRWDPKFCRHLLSDPEAGPTVVGAYRQWASPYGCLDMLGNVMEWTDSMFAPYPGSELDPNRRPFGARTRTRRGGSWHKQYERFIPVRCSARYALSSAEAKMVEDLRETGFRCVKNVE